MILVPIWEGVKWNIRGVGKGFSNSVANTPPGYRVAVYGYNKEELKKQVATFAQKLEEHPRIKAVDIEANIEWWTKDLYEYEMSLDKKQLGERGISPTNLNSIFNQYNLDPYADFYTPRQYAVRLVNHQLNEKDLWQLQHNPITSDSSQFYFKDIGKIKKKKISNAIHKESQQYIRMLEWQYMGAARFGDAYFKEKKAEMEKELPLGYRIERNKFAFWQEQTKNQYSLFLLIIGLIFFICAIQFESFQQAIAIILLIPISYIGIFLTFYGFDFTFDQGGYTSFILLSGLVVNGLILIISDFNYYQKKYPNRSFLSIYSKAFEQKITPILLTIFSTSLGLAPFLMHGQTEVFWFSLAVGTIGGLLFSIIVLTCFIPLFLKN